ncbi:hypothetical protein ACLB2K_027245 [Fragaria x ananassa]
MDHEYSYTTLTIEKILSFVNFKLKTREMYFFWKTLFEKIFKRYKLTDIVDGSEPCPDRFLIDMNGNITNQADPAFDVWHEKDQKIIMWLKSTLSEDVALPLVISGDIPSNSSRELWLGLEKRFAVAGVPAEYRRSMFSGRVVTLKVFEDNTSVLEALSRQGEGRVLVVDGGGSMRRAITGGKVAKYAELKGWAGIVVKGCVRDVDEINECEIGVRALATCPVRPTRGKDGSSGQRHVDVNIGGTWILEGEWLYADNDGILVSTTKLSI